jgi:anti-sigma regulatory factor (Ser/Thr protein kinase)
LIQASGKDHLLRSGALALDLPMTAAAPGLARQAVDRFQLDTSERESARLLASELVTNALLHSAAARTTSIRIDARISGHTLRISVTDRGTAANAVAPRHDPGPGGGFGLFLVERLAARWGVERNGSTTVWCELLISEPRRATHRAGPASAEAGRVRA